ncbi:MAG: radical SAM family heme chaperone HemW [Bacteroides sp.]|nr:radical SAM family heme chaperone HemW [Bacteroides sp.]
MLYIHIPYCRRKCLYCDFFSGGARIADWTGLADALLAELQERIEELPERIESIYIGGGTPSLMPPDVFGDFTSRLRQSVDAAGKTLVDDVEFTIEINPEDVDDRHIEVWREAGVNRVSIGIQTFDNRLLQSIGRSHTGDMAEMALKRLKAEFENVSGDLIFGIPGQSVEDLRRDVYRLIDCGPEHVSVYSMMYEEGTALTALRDAGRVEEADDDTVARQYECLTEILGAAGYEHYEISNYARPGFRSRHNSGYWTGKPYLGIGPSAHSFDGVSVRRANPADLRGYLGQFGKFRAGETSFFTEEKLNRDERLEEWIMLSLRRCEGLNLKQLCHDFGREAERKVRQKAAGHLAAGNLIEEPGGIRLSRKGIMIADAVMVDLI